MQQTLVGFTFHRLLFLFLLLKHVAPFADELGRVNVFLHLLLTCLLPPLNLGLPAAQHIGFPSLLLSEFGHAPFLVRFFLRSHLALKLLMRLVLHPCHALCVCVDDGKAPRLLLLEEFFLFLPSKSKHLLPLNSILPDLLLLLLMSHHLPSFHLSFLLYGAFMLLHKRYSQLFPPLLRYLLGLQVLNRLLSYLTSFAHMLLDLLKPFLHEISMLFLVRLRRHL
mmetsp:Transcript_8671/g.24187  ORF Transcript_8671/g.24187 Transcript_8671/m.24187 type:complete len:223 (-) Transcript_8671:575-1243(-)